MISEAVDIGFLVSGGGGTLKSLYYAIDRLNLPVRIVSVIADRECGAYRFAQNAGLASCKADYRPDDPAELSQYLRSLPADVYITNIHRIIDKSILDSCTSMFVNLHYSLLPSFGKMIGMSTLKEARKAEVTLVGATCHQVNEYVDEGRILSQAAFGCDWSRDREEELQDCMFRAASIILIDTIARLASAKVVAQKASVEKICSRDVLFSPGLSLDVSLLNDNYWQRVALVD